MGRKPQDLLAEPLDYLGAAIGFRVQHLVQRLAIGPLDQRGFDSRDDLVDRQTFKLQSPSFTAWPPAFLRTGAADVPAVGFVLPFDLALLHR
jgi:hypothetical protein